MKAVAFQSHGGIDVLHEMDLPDPQPGPGQVRIRVRACALNHLDIWVREGWPQLKLPLPHILGSDVAGVIDALGAGISDVRIGDEVAVNPGLSCGHCELCLSGRDNLCPDYKIIGEHSTGGYAQYLCVPRQNLLPKPPKLSFEETACLPLTFLTAWGMLVDRARLVAGETVLVHAAGSGVGSAAVQIAKLKGATVIATAGTDDKLEKARALGADHLINYERQDFLAEVKKITGRKLCDVVFEHTGQKTWEKSVVSLKVGGRLVTCGASSGFDARIDLRVLFMRQISLLGSTMGSKASLHEIFRFVEAGKLRPVMDQAMPLSDARKAHERMAQRAQFGKLVLVPS
jgi:NADPH:quinone reductase-like Zn-dependent oxidoreductase